MADGVGGINGGSEAGGCNIGGSAEREDASCLLEASLLGCARRAEICKKISQQASAPCPHGAQPQRVSTGLQWLDWHSHLGGDRTFV